MPKPGRATGLRQDRIINDPDSKGAKVFESSFILELSGIGGPPPSIHGGGDAAGGGWVGLIDTLLDKLTRATEPGGGFELLPGIQALGPNVHPSLVHFPIAFLSVFFLLELLGTFMHREKLRQAAAPMLYCGAIGAAAAAAAGLYAAGIVHHGQVVHEIMEWHQRLGLTVAGLALILSVWRLLAKHAIAGMERALYLFLAGIMTTSMVFGADLGGLMVYGHGVAVQKLQTSDDAHHHHGDADPGGQR